MLKEIGMILVERREFFGELFLDHLRISLISIFIAIAIGFALGILISEYHRASKTVISIVNFIYTIPSISLLGLLIPLSGIGNTTAVIALSVYALMPMVKNTYTGLRNVNALLVEAAAGMGSTRWQILYKVKIPLAMPVILVGIRNMAVMVISLAGIASFIGAGGLGVAIYRGITTNNQAMTLAGSILIAAFAIAVDLVIGSVETMLKKRIP